MAKYRCVKSCFNSALARLYEEGRVYFMDDREIAPVKGYFEKVGGEKPAPKKTTKKGAIGRVASYSL